MSPRSDYTDEERDRARQHLEDVQGGAGGWPRYERMVLHELERLAGAMERLEGKFGTNTTEIAVLKKSLSLYAAIAGLLASAIVQFVVRYFAPGK
jgi:hypothetical protein